MERTSETSFLGPGDFEGSVTLIGESGWMQSLTISFGLSIGLLYKTEGEFGTILAIGMEVDGVLIRVAKSLFKEEFHRSQLIPRRISILFEPTVNGFAKGSIPEDYRYHWTSKYQYPSKMSYYEFPYTMSREKQIGAKLQVGMMPNASFEYTQSSSRGTQLPPLASIIDIQRSELQGTPYGGFLWSYEISQTEELTRYDHIELELHRGKSGFPESNVPSSIQTKITTVFDVRRKGSVTNLFTPDEANGISISFRQIKMIFTVDVHWCQENMAEFPGKRLGSKELTLTHDFRNGYKVTPRQEKLSGLETEMTIEGMANKEKPLKR